jgi:NADH:ubiquinone reductase (H+-translocating)
VVFIGRVHLTGFAAWLMWLLVHLAFLTGFNNRLAAVTNWAVAFLGHDRRQRTITEQQVFARTREVKQPEAVAPFAVAVPARGAHADHSGMAGIVKTVKPTPFLTLADES